MLSEKIFPEIASRLGLGYKSVIAVAGGDINKCYLLKCSERIVFVKTNASALLPEMFEKEARSLELLKRKSRFIVPEVLLAGTFGTLQFLALEFIESGSATKNYWLEFGHCLAALHKNSQEHFGFEEDNYIGSIVQPNRAHSTWASFYAHERLWPMSRALEKRGLMEAADLKMLEKLCHKLETVFPPEAPALLHGDLWSGNVMYSQRQGPCIFDPAVYYGHREMDLGMTLMFGGFDSAIYGAYNETYPLEKNWRKRVELAQLYPTLVHALLFGESYLSRAKGIIKAFSY